MGLRYRKSIKLLPGVKLNISKSGLSTSVGKPGNTLNISRRGTRSTIGIPGTGLSYSQMLTKGKSRRSRRTSRQRAQDTRFEMKQKFGLNDREIDRLLKLYKKHPRKFSRMSEQEMMEYAHGRIYSSGRTKTTIGFRFSKVILFIILIILVLAFVGSFSQK
jgi:hypothetical protein